MMKRASGVLMHVSSLWGKYGCGSFDGAAREFIDFLSDCGFSYWQVLPFCMVDDCNSPYKSYSAFGGNPYFISLDKLVEKGLLTDEEASRQLQAEPFSCEFDKLRATRLDILKLAASRVKDRAIIENFINNSPYLEKLARFMAIKEANGDSEWKEWTAEAYTPEEYFAWQFIQYEFFDEWREIKEYANLKGIKIIGDMPIYVAYDSADVWGDRDNFLLEENGDPCAVAGVPPDYFAKDGQLWGNPLYDWNEMKKDGYSWWLDRLEHMLTMFDGVRIDHFRGLESYYSIPFGAETAKDGRWCEGPGKDLIDKMKELAGDKLIIAEDLGDITPEVYELVRYSGFPGMRVLQFGFLNDGDSIHKPHNYTHNTVAYTGTHDNNTLLGYVWELDDKTRREVLSYCGYEDEDWDNGYDSIIRTMLQSHAGLVIIPVQDLLHFGADTRLNRPGSSEGNWAYRVLREQLFSIDRQKYRRLNEIYNRI